jgi:hypothetical protein
MRIAAAVLFVLALGSGCSSSGGDGVSTGDTFDTSYGTATVIELGGQLALSFPDCTDKMRDAGDGRLVDFDPVRDAGVPAPPNGDDEWLWNCG